MSRVYKLTELDYFASVSNGICFVKFWSETCGPCKQYEQIFKDFASKVNYVKCYSVDAMREMSLSINFGIKSVPLTIIYKDGNQVKKLSGVKTVEELEKELELL